MKHIILTTRLIKKFRRKLFFVFLFLLNINAFSQNCSVNANIEQTICPNSPFVLVGSKTGLFQGGAGYQIWTQIGGPAVTITNPTQLSTTVTGFTANTSYKFRLTTTCLDGALVYDTVIYNVLPHTISNAGPDQYFCPGIYTLTGNSPGTGESGSWSIVGSANGLVLSNSTSPNATITLPGNYSGPTTLRWTISSINGCSSYDDVIIYNRGGVTPVSAGPFQTLSQCYSTTSTATLAGSYAGTGIDGQIGTWSVITGPNTPGFGNANSYNTTVNNLIQGTYILRWTVSGPCVNGYDEMQIIVPAPVGSVSSASITSGNQVFCDTRTNAVLSGTPPLYVNETSQWVQTGGPSCTIVNPTSATTTVTGLNGSSTYTFIYRITNSFTGCVSTSSSRTISYTVAPTINAGADKILAPDVTSTTINWTSIGGNQTRYNVISYPAGYTPPGWTTTTSPTTITGLNYIGTYVVQFRRYTNGGTGSCTEAYDDVNIFVSKTPTGSNAGTDQVLACNITNTSLVGNTPIVGSGTWSQVSGPNTAVISDIYAPNTPISNLIPGIYTFRWSISAGINSPVYRDDVSVKVVSAVPSNVNAGSDRTVCYSSPVTMHANNLTLNESGTWTVSPSSGVNISNIHSPSAVVTGLQPSTTYTFTWTVYNACGSLSDDVIITTTSSQGPVQANAGADQCQPSGTSTITLAGNNPSPGTGTWSKISGPACTITNPSQSNTTVTGVSSGTYIFQWSIMFNGCGPTLDTVIVTVSQSGTTAAAGPDQSICGNSVTLAGNTPTVGVGLWTIVSGSGGATITNPSSPTTTVTGLTDDIYTFRWTISNYACPSTSDDVQINVSTPPTTANAGVDQNICGGTTATLSANTITNGTGTWSIITAPSIPTFSNVNAPNATISGLVMGTYTLRWTAQAGTNCSASTDDVLINVAPNANAGSTQNLCDISTTVLTGNALSTGTWTYVSGPNTPTITPAGSNTANVTGMITGSYVFRYTISSGFCPETSATVTVNTFVFGSTPTAGPDQNLCNAASFTMAGNSPSIGTGTWTKVSGPSGGSFSPNANTANATFSPSQSGVYYFNWTITNGGCTLSDQVRIENFANPTTANAGPDKDNCGMTTSLAGNTPISGTGNWTLVSGPGTASISAPISPTSSVTVSTSGTYIFRWTISNGVCTASSDDVSIVFKTLPTTANAGTDQSLCNVTSTTLAGNSITTGSGLWSQMSGPNTASITTPGSPTSTITGMIPGTYVFRWSSTYNGCSTSDDVQITISAPPSTANAGPDQNLCNYASVTLGGNTPAVGTGTWTQVSGPSTVSFSSPNSPNSGVLGTVVGTYVFRWTISNGTCVNSSDDVSITIYENPSLAVAGFDQNLCNIYSATMAATAPTIGTGTWTRISGPNNPVITNNHSATTTITGLVAGTYIFDWTVANGICTSSDQMQIKVDDLPTTPNAGPDLNLCNVSTVTMAGNSPTTGTGVWSRLSGPNTPTITDPSSPTTTLTGMITGTYVYRWTISNGSCTALTDDVTIIISEAVTASNAGSDQNQCNVSSITLSANSPTVGVGAWTMVSGPNTPSITNPNTSNSTVTGLISGTYVFQWAITNGSCSSTDQVQINNYSTPTTANAGVDQTLCGVTSATLAGNTPSTGTGVWSNISGPNVPSISSPSSPTSAITGLIPGTYVLRWTISNGSCTSSTDDVQIIITAAASTANAGPDQEHCNTLTFTMAGNTPSSGTGTWTMVSGPNTPTITNPNSPSTTITGVTSGTYIFKWEITLGTCSSSDQVQIINYASPTTANAGTDQSLCNVVTATLAGNTPSSGTGSWSMVSGPNTPTITDLSSASSTITGMIAGTYVFRWTISNGICPVSSDEVQIVISAAATTANAGTDQDLCNLNFATMAGNTPSSGTGNWTMISGPNTPIISNPGTPTTTITGLTTGTYIFEWKITNGACSSSDQVQIINYVTPSTADAGSDQTLCNVTSVTLAGNTPTTGTGNWTMVSGPNTPAITTPSSATSSITGMTAGTYIFRWTISNGTCTSSSDDVQITISAGSSVANAGSDQTGISMCGLTSTTLTGNTPASGTGLWTIVSGSGGNIISPSSPNSTFTGISGTTYVLKWTITNPPCPATEDMVTITFESLPVAPTVATSDRNSLCPGDAGSISLSASGGAGTILKWFTGSCGGSSIGTGTPLLISAPTATTTYYARWENLCGSSPCATVTVNVSDNVNPTITCPPTVISYVDAGSCTASGVSLGTPVTSDNCSVASVTNNAPSTFPLGNTVVTWTVTDGSGNTATCTQTVRIMDNINPTITCGVTGPQNVNANASCKYNVTWTTWNATASDNCGVASLNYTLTGATTGSGTTLNGVSFNLGTTTVTWTATDNSGNFTTCSYTVVVTDNTNPVITSCGGSGTLNVNANSSCKYDVSGTAWDATATDNCGLATLTYTLTGATTGTGTTLNGVSFNLGSTNVVWTAIDNAGNSTICNFTVVVKDQTNPTITSCGATGTQNVTANSGCNYVLNGNAWDATASDNCAVATLTYILTGATTGTGTSLNGITFNSGNTTVTWTATDAAGNSANCSFTVSVSDNINPVISSCGVTGTQNVFANSSCKYIVNGTAWNATATDNCGVSTLAYTLSGATTGSGTSLNGISFNLGITTVTWTATDAAGNTATCNFDVKVTDNTNPVITSCGATGTQNVNTNNSCFYNVSGTAWDATANDNCGVSSLSYLLTGATAGSGATLNGVSFNLGTTTVTWTATDAAGNTATCSFNVVVTDIVNPVFASCGATGTQSVFANDACKYIVSGNAWNPTVTENCGTATVAYTLSGATTGSGTSLNGANFNLGVTTVTWTATDAAGNTATCNFDVKVTDNINPTITSCGVTGTQNVNANSGCSYVLSGNAWNASATDNCGVSSLIYTLTGATTGTGTTLNGVTFNSGTTTVIWTATDAAGNSSSCSFNVVVADVINPVFSSCGATGNQNVNANSSCKYIINGTAWDAVATDNCGVSTLIYTLSGATTGTGTTLNGVSLNLGNTMVTWVVTDAAGNTASCSFNVIVSDNTNPVITSCGVTGTQVVNANSTCHYIASGTAWNATATDNCGISTLNYTLSGATSGTGTTLDGVIFNLGTTNVTWVATDNAGNTSNCSFSVIVTDNINPVISSCGATGTQTVNANSSCKYTITGTLWDATASDNCGISTLVYSLSGATTGTGTSLNGVVLNQGTTTITWTATDAAGNSSNCSFSVIVADHTNPIITSCGGSGTQTVNSNSGCSYLLSGTAWDAIATDNCSTPTLSYSLSGATTGTGATLNGVTFNTGTTTVIWTATDASGNTTNCNFNVVVTDNVNPVISSCGASGTQNVNANSACKYIVNGTAWDATASDNCGVSTISYTLSGATTGNGTTLNGVGFNIGTTMVTWLVTDAAGNTATCNFNVVVTDNINPVISSCGATGTQNVTSNSGCAYTVSGNAWNASATDNCSVSSLTYSLSGATTGTGANLNGVIFNNGTTTVTWTATDAAGNSASCNFDVVVKDNINPIFSTCGASGTQNVFANSGCRYIVSGTAWDAIATDNCGVSTITYTLSGATTGTGNTLNGVSFNSGTTLVTWLVTDAAGNTANCSFNVVVADNVNPVISSCGATGTQNVSSNSGCNYQVNGNAWDAVATDNCGIATIVYTLSGATTGTGTSLNGVTFNKGTTTVVWTATDNAGNNTNCSFTVIVSDHINPVISSCGATGTQNVIANSSCQYVVSGNGWDATATDNCGVSTLTYSLSGATTGSGTSLDGVIFNSGTTIVTWLATDSSGNTSNCSFTVIVKDQTNPVITCSGPVIFSTSPGSCNAIGISLTAPVASDNCSVSSLVNNAPFIYPVGNTNVIWIATDGAGNSSSCSQLVKVNAAPLASNDIYVIPEDAPAPFTVLSNDYDCDNNLVPSTVHVITGPSHGITSVDPLTGVITYIPTTNYNGTDQFNYSVCDSSALCTTATVFITIISSNDPPVTINEHITINEDTPATGSVLTNGDFDPDGTSLFVNIVPITGPTNGIFTINSSGIYNYTPNNNYTGNDIVVVSVCDNGIPLPSMCSNDTIFITILPFNDPPVTFNEHFNTNQNVQITASVLTNGDYDPDGTVLSVISSPLTGPVNGTVTISSNGNFVYTPALNYYGNDMFVVNVCDNGIPLPSQCATDTVFITINAVNLPPVTTNETFNICQNEQYSGNVLSNGDHDPDGTALSVSTPSVYGPLHGTFNLALNGSYTYTPAVGFYGQDMVVVNICDNGNPLPPACSYDTLFITVNQNIQAFGGQDQSWCSQNNTFLTGNLPAGSTGNWTQLSGPNTVLISPPNTSAVSVNGMIIGTYYFLYTLTIPNSNGYCSSTDTVKVVNYQYPSIAYAGPDQYICYNGGQTTSIVLNGNIPTVGYGVWQQVLGPTTAVFADSLNHNTSVSNITNGEYGFNWVIRSGPCAPAYDYVHIKINHQPVVDAGPDGQICSGGVWPLTGATASNYLSLHWTTTGTGTFSNPTSLNPIYTPSTADETVGTVTLTLYANGINVCPDQSDAMVLTINAIPPPLVCPNDTIVYTDAGTCSAYVNVPLTNLSLSTNCITSIENSFNNTDNASGTYPLGTTTVFWTATYADGTTTNCAHNITVIDSIHPQITCPGDITQNINSGCNTTILIPTVNYADNCSVSSLTWTMTGATTASSASSGINQIGNFTFNAGLTIVTYTVTDGANNSTSCSFNVNFIDNVFPTIICQGPLTFNTPPGSCSVSGVNLGTPITFDNCTIDTVTNNSPTSFPTGITTVVWTVIDASGNTATCNQLITVNSTPLAINDSATTNEESPVTINVLTNDIDCDNNLSPGTVNVTTAPSHGTTSVDHLTGNITYNPNTNYYGTDQFIYHVCDSTGLCTSATVFITVLPINHPPTIINENIAFCQNGVFSGNILSNGDQDPEGMPLNAVTSAVSGPLHGNVTIGSNGAYTYTPNAGYYGTDMIVISVCDNGTPPPLNLPPACANDTIFVNVNQIIQANAGSDQEWCNGVNSFLIGNSQNGTTGNWVQISGPNTVVLTPQNSPSVSVAGMIPGHYKFVYTLVTISPTGNCTSTDTVDVINYNLPSISYAGPDQVLCLGGGTTTSTTIIANNPTFGYGMWEQVLGPTVVNFADSMNHVTVVSNLAAGEYGFNWVINNGICQPQYDYLHITVNPTPVVNAGPDAQTCQGIPYDLVAANASGYQSVHWSTSGTGTFNNILSVNPTYTPSLADAIAGSVTLTLTGEGYSPCPDMTDAMVLTVTLNPAFSCPPSITQSTDLGSCTATVTDTLSAIVINSSCVTSVINSYNNTNNASGIFPIGTTNIVWTVTYADGSVVTCNQSVTISDTTSPIVSCSGNISQNIINGCSTVVTVPDIQFSDNCTSASLTWTMTGATVANSPLTGINQVGTHTFNVGLTTITYTVTDSEGNSTNCTTSVTVNDNINPTISCAGSISVQSDPGACTASGVLLTTPTTGDNCSVTTVTNNAPVSFPVGTTVVVWTASDSSGNTATCTQTVTVIGAPLAVDDYDTTSINTPVAVTVLANDLDCDNNLNPGSVYVNGQPSNGTVVVNPTTGVITYTPNNNYYGTDQFNYQVCDFTGFCSTATVYIGVGLNNGIPHVPDSSVTINEDESVTICLPIIDIDGPLPFTVSNIGCYANGTASAIIAGNNVCISYIPNHNFNGLDSVCIVVCDGGALCDSATLVINVLPVNDPPFVPDTTITTIMDSTVTACIPITDIDGTPPFSVSNVGCYSNGTASAQIVGNTVCVTYVPDSGFIGVDSICITVCDSAGACDTSIITVNVAPPLAKAVIGLAKEAGIPELQPDGSYNVNFIFKVQNLGNTKLTNVQVADSLIDAFPPPAHYTIIVPPVSTGTLTPNSNYNGMNDVNLLVDTASYVNVGTTETISLVVNIKTVGFFGPYYNSAFATALDTTGMASVDTSNNGTIVDPNGNGNPNEVNENIPTPVILTPNTMIGVAKAATTPELQSDGSFNVKFIITVKNMGNDTLRNIKVTDDLAATFPSPAVFSVIGMPTVSGTLQPNSSYNGTTDIDLVISPSSMLDTGATATVGFTVNVVIPIGSQNNYYNFAIGRGTGNGGVLTSDTSTNGYDPDPNHNGKPNDSTENTATPVIINSLDVFIPEGFSPNGDGINDYFVIRGLETYPENVLSVYNRWGNLIYQKKGYDNTWDGTSNSHNMNLGRDKVQPGTYFYILELNKDEKKPMNGYVVIKY